MKTKSKPGESRAERRLVFGEAELAVSHVTDLGRLNYRKADKPLLLHSHAQAMEIVYAARGQQTYVVQDTPHLVRGGEYFVSFPDEAHSTGGTPEEKSVIYWLVVRLHPARGFLGLPAHEARSLRQALLALPRRQFAATARTQARLEEALALAPEQDPLARLQLRLAFVDLLLEVVRCAQASVPLPKRKGIHAAMSHIQQHLDQVVRLEDLATAASMSLSHFKRVFRQEVGIPPREYILRAKIVEAQQRLRASVLSITEIAFDLGFSSSAYFATVFKRFAGMPPRAWRAASTPTTSWAPEGRHRFKT